MSNVVEHKGKSNDLLKTWLAENPDYKTNFIQFDYSNSNYQTLVRDKNASVEVLVVNYEPKEGMKVQTLFDGMEL